MSLQREKQTQRLLHTKGHRKMKEEARDAVATGMDAIVTGMDAGESMEQISTQSLPLKEANSLQHHLRFLSSRANWKMVNSVA